VSNTHRSMDYYLKRLTGWLVVSSLVLLLVAAIREAFR